MARDVDEMFMTRSLNVTPKTTKQHLIARSDKSVAYVTNNKRLDLPKLARVLRQCIFVCCASVYAGYLLIKQTRRWHVTISCQPDGRPPQPVRPWKSGRVHLAEGSNIVVLELPYSTELGRQSKKFASGVRKYGKFSHFLTHPVVYGGQGKKNKYYLL